MRLVLGLEYDGSAFCGWQTQPEGCGVQDVLEKAVSEIACEKVSVVCAGRTDAGVHAFSQVVHFNCDQARPLSAWTRGVNSLLAPGVSVLWVREVSDQFHARHSATARRYKYYLLNRTNRPGLFRPYVGWFHAPLDADLMHAAAQSLVGTYDFSAFRSTQCQAKSPVRTVRELNVTRTGDAVCFDITANAFLHHMVRNIVGALIYVGCGRQQVPWLGAVLEGRDRTRAAPTFSPNGLYLYAVEYAGHWALPAMAPISLHGDLFAAL